MNNAIDHLIKSNGDGLAVLKTLAENSFDSILITDDTENGDIVYANPAFETLTGFDRTEVIGKTPRILQGNGTDEKVIARLSSALKSGGEFEGKAINYKKDGTPFIMYWRVVPVKINDKIHFWIAIQREGSHI
ncbi:PAS domain-containing protein [Alphaproteobacteria bacterium]|nr:PAS domain-containing protein [Alphaproteobacteria bacterium]